jgi:hypothetical protein
LSWKRKIYHTILDVTPPLLLRPILRIASAAHYLTYPAAAKQAIKRNESLKNVALGKTAFVLATGPSVRGLDLSRIVGQDCYTVSNFFLHPLIGDLCPRMHFFAPYHEPLVLEEFIAWLDRADQSLPETTEITLGMDTEGTVSQNNLFKDRSVHYLGLEKEAIRTSIDLRYPVMKPQSVPLMVIPVLLFMGYKRIVLVGCDHNILKDYGKTVSNFYENNLDPRSNATSGANWEAGIVQHLRNALNVFAQYQKYQEYCQKKNVELIHTSPEGWLDFIRYVPFDEILLSDPEGTGYQHGVGARC